MLDPSKVDAAVRHAVELQTRIHALMQPVLTQKDATAASLAVDVIQVRRLRDAYEMLFSKIKDADAFMCATMVPEAFEREKISTFNLKMGYRITVSQRYFASIIPEWKADAYKWLRKNKLGDLIQETVNAGTLSAAGRKMIEDQHKELPEELFRTHYQFNTSITALQKGKQPVKEKVE